MTKKLRVGIIGAGLPGQQHGRAIRGTRNAVLQTLAEPNEERAAEFRQTYPGREWQADRQRARARGQRGLLRVTDAEFRRWDAGNDPTDQQRATGGLPDGNARRYLPLER
ncbi:MAG: Gfo/Idh/MocA family oxidoreductase [Chthoniobacterales bacterium]